VPGPPIPEATILLVEDDDTIGRHLTNGLGTHGYPTTWCRTGSAALVEAREKDYQVVLLDLGLPDLDGLDVARDLRHRHPDLLIIMLTARGDDIDVVAGLDVGANDYLIKPVSLSVLLARLRAHLRRPQPADTRIEHGDDPLAVGELTVDTAAHRCWLGTTEVVLRPKEFDLLVQLAAHPGLALRREDLMAAVWDENWFGSTKTLDVTMAALRRRLEEATATSGLTEEQTPMITTLRGHGYRLETPSAADTRHSSR
jgi:DNA-binding response OmpR family regulator